MSFDDRVNLRPLYRYLGTLKVSLFVEMVKHDTLHWIPIANYELITISFVLAGVVNR